MEDKIKCPKCYKLNDIQKFCIYCGEHLFDDEGIKIFDNPEPHCLNCGRPVKIGQTKCECGYEFADIDCPKCNAKNEYTYKFCISCGEKLWKSTVYDYMYSKRLFEHHLLKETLPYELHNISVYKRSTNRLNENSFNYNHLDSNSQLKATLERLKSKDSNADNSLYEISSRWRIVSPNHCIRCLRLYSGVCSCMTPFLTDKKRIEFLQTEKNYYIEPKFDIEDLKLTMKNKPKTYLASLAPAIGESQLEYRERLKWEFVANIDRKEKIKNVIANLNNTLKLRNSKPQTVERDSKGNYCGYGCVHFREEYIIDYDGDGNCYDEMPEYFCELGCSEVYTRSFCKYYE